MPKAKVRARGGAVRARTVKLPGDKYMVCDVTKKSGPRGGRTVCGKPKKK